MTSNETQKIKKGAIINVIFRITEGIVSLFVIVQVANKFGTDVSSNAYLLSNAFVSLLLLVGEGILAITFLPIFIEYREKQGMKEAFEFANSFFTLMLACLLILSALVLMFAPVLVSIVAPGFIGREREITTSLLRVSSPMIILIGTTSILNSIFYSMKSFTVPALTSVLPGIGRLTFLILFVQDVGVLSIPSGGIVGIVINILVLLYFLEKNNKGLRFVWKPHHPGIGKTMKLMGPRLLGEITTRLNQIVDNFFASTLAQGSVSTLNYAQRVIQIPGLLVLAGLGKTLVPVFSEYGTAGKHDKIRDLIYQSLSIINFFITPLMIFFFILRFPIVSLFFQRGACGTKEILSISTAFFNYNIGLMAYSYNLIFTITYLSLRDTVTPMKIGIAALILNFIIDFNLMKVMGIGGIALATSLVDLLRMGLLFAYLQKKIGRLDVWKIANSFKRCLLPASVMGVVIWLTMNMGTYFKTLNLRYQAFLTPISIVLGLMVYIASCYVFKTEGYTMILAFIKKRK